LGRRRRTCRRCAGRLFWIDTEDERGPGGAVTEELCGALDHDPPCPVAAHFSSAVRRGMMLEVRVLFACESADETDVRSRIDAALARRWQVLTAHPEPVADDEAEHAARLVVS
jgi:hypothetical protein